MITIDEIKNRVMTGLVENYKNEYEITPRMVSTFSSAVKGFIDKGKIDGSEEAIDKLICSDISKDFVRNKQPLTSAVSKEVIFDVYDFFKGNIPNVEVYSIARASNHPDDKHLYSVVGRDWRDGEFMCWTSWNESTKSLNYGHYGYKDFQSCHDIISENFNDITDDVMKYGPDVSIVMLSDKQREELHNEREEQHKGRKDDINPDKLVSMEDAVVKQHRRAR